MDNKRVIPVTHEVAKEWSRGSRETCRGTGEDVVEQAKGWTLDLLAQGYTLVSLERVSGTVIQTFRDTAGNEARLVYSLGQP